MEQAQQAIGGKGHAVTGKFPNGTKSLSLLDRLAEETGRGKERKNKVKPDSAERSAILASWERFHPRWRWFYDYDMAVDAVRNLHLRPKDVEWFSLKLADMQQEENFSFKAGLFLSAMINKGKGRRYVVHTDHLDKPVEAIGYKNNKSITIGGDAGAFCGKEMLEGKIVVKGNVDDECGQWMNRGTIIVHGSIGTWSPSDRIGTSVSHGGQIFQGEKLIVDKGYVVAEANK